MDRNRRVGERKKKKISLKRREKGRLGVGVNWESLTLEEGELFQGAQKKGTGGLNLSDWVPNLNNGGRFTQAKL